MLQSRQPVMAEMPRLARVTCDAIEGREHHRQIPEKSCSILREELPRIQHTEMVKRICKHEFKKCCDDNAFTGS